MGLCLQSQRVSLADITQSPKGQKEMGRRIPEAQALELGSGLAGQSPCSLFPQTARGFLAGDWGGGEPCVGSWLPAFGESCSESYLDPLVSGPLRNLGVLPSNSLGGREGRRKRGRGLGIAAPMGAQRTGCSCCLLGNQSLGGRGPSDKSPCRVSTHRTHAPPSCSPLGLSPEAEVRGLGGAAPGRVSWQRGARS